MELKNILNDVLAKRGGAFFYSPKIFGESTSYLFLNPADEIKYSDAEKFLAQLDNKCSTDKIGFAVLPYELGYELEKSLNYLVSEPIRKMIEAKTLAFFFDRKDVIKIQTEELKIPCTARAKSLRLKLSENYSSYGKKILEIKEHILEGNSYQTNFTMKGIFNCEDDPAELFLQLIQKQSAAYSAFINLGDEILISVSPELFFEIDGREITTRPMKGTIKRGINHQTDSIQKYSLLHSEKDRAENIMIVDLLRNDLGKICEFGSVTAENRFMIEKYESVFQMVSEVKGRLRSETKFSDAVKSLYPCGSVTGAPKIRTMRIISELENQPRGIYTGAIGILSREKIIFNVAIRTIDLNRQNKIGEIGLGGGIVADSQPRSEYNECKLKGKFFQSKYKPFQLFESMLIENGEIFLLKEHLQRLRTSAEFFLFNFSESYILEAIEMQVASIDRSDKIKLKISLDKWGNITTEKEKLELPPKEIIVNIAPKRINSNNEFQYFKTTERKSYDSAMRKNKKSGIFESIFLNERSEIAEGAFTNVFIKESDWLITPPLRAGILNGVHRNFLLATNKNVEERTLTISDLIYADEIILVNSVRKEIKVDKFYFSDNEYKKFN